MQLVRRNGNDTQSPSVYLGLMSQSTLPMYQLYMTPSTAR